MVFSDFDLDASPWKKNTQTCSMDPTSNFLGMMLIGFSVPWQSCTPSCWGNRQFFQSVRGTYPSVKLNRWGSSGCKPQTSSLGTEVKEAAIQCLIQTSGLLSSLHPIPALKHWLAWDTLTTTAPRAVTFFLIEKDIYFVLKIFHWYKQALRNNFVMFSHR